MMSSCSSSLIACRPASIRKCNPVSQFRAKSVGAAVVLRWWQPIRSFWCFPFCSSLRCGDLWRGKQSTTRMESNGASGSTFRAGPSPADKVEQRPTRQYNFDTIVLEPTGKHLATVVWLHGFSDSGARWATELRNVNQLSPNIRWIIPTASLARDMPVTACKSSVKLHNVRFLMKIFHFLLVMLKSIQFCAFNVATSGEKGCGGVG